MSSSSTSSFEEYGPNIVFNGNFDGNASGWILSGGMTYENYHIVAQPSSIAVKRASQSLETTVGLEYLVEYEIVIDGNATSSFSLGNQFVSHDNEQGLLSSIVSVEDLQPLTINVIVQSGKIYITNISVREVLRRSSSSSSLLISDISSSSTRSTSSLSFVNTTSSSESSVSSSSLWQSSSLSSQSSETSQTISLTSSSLSSLSYSSSSSTSSFSTSSISTSSISSSSLSLSSQSSISISSSSSSSISSISSRTSKSTSSSADQTTSSSQSSLSSSSSSSSINKGYFLLPFNFESENGKQIWCFARKDNYVYAGTGPFGKIIRSSDSYKWEEFNEVDDSHVMSLFVWANALFVGTQPHGKIYVYNFTTNSFYNIVQTEDSCVSCFAEYNDQLYVGTSPIGVVYRFNGEKWSRLYQAYGNGITSMCVYDNLLYIFSNKAESAMVYDGNKWMSMKTKEIIVEEAENTTSSSSITSISSQSEIVGTITPQTVAVKNVLKNEETFHSFRNNKYEPLSDKGQFIDRSTFFDFENKLDVNEIKPLINTKTILSSCTDGSKLYMGSDNGVLFSYPDANENVEILHQNDEQNITQIINIDNNKLMFSVGNKLYFLNKEDKKQT